MYAVSDAYKKAIQDNTRSYYWTGKITLADGTEYPFGNKDIVKGSGYVTRQCCGSNEIELGTVYAAELGITLLTDIDRYSLTGATITLSFHLDIGDGVYEEVPMGVFEISEANRTIKCLEIKAYDYMLRFDADFDEKVTNGVAFDLLLLACEACKVELANTKEELSAMPNGSYVLGVYTENDIETWRDLIFYIAQVLGCFAQIDRTGKLKLTKYGYTPVADIPDTQRFSSSFSDFITRYTAVSSTNVRTKTAEYYALDPDDGLTMNLSTNPLLQFGLAETRKTLLTNILSDIAVIRYVPFDSTTIGNPAFDPADVITFSGGQADAKQITAVTSITIKVNGKHSLKCVGKNPRLTQAKSKNDKNITGLVNQIEAGKIVVHSYLNASPYTIGSTDTEIVSIEFASNEDTDAQFFASILMDVKADEVTKTGQATGTITLPASTSGGSATTQDENFTLTWTDDGDAVIQVTYIINDNVLTTYYPIETWKSGKHILNLYYPLSGLTANTYNTFRVWLKMSGGSASVGRAQAIATISGQGLSANKVWDGRLEFSDTAALVRFSGLKSVGYTAAVSTELITPTPAAFLDSLPLFRAGGLSIAAFTDTAKVDPVVVTETINVADKRKMAYSAVYVKVTDKFELQTAYAYKSAEGTIDEGRMCRLTVNTEQFASVTGLEVKNG
ncbi:hypothetical protein HCH52_00030 [Oscillospiraceae bacterium HV4-5-C5C]|nr:hypothetical protein [Oscillospiraceae bacterium HV4-5-C5C]